MPNPPAVSATLAAELGAEPDQPQWRIVSETPVPIEQFGKDHWSTFAYVETRTVDHKGRLNVAQMRCHAKRHPMLVDRNRLGSSDGSRYATRLRGGELADHDDWDCLDDLVAAGLLEVAMPKAPNGGFFTGLEELELGRAAVWSLTERGREVAGRLRAHIADRKGAAAFDPRVD